VLVNECVKGGAASTAMRVDPHDLSVQEDVGELLPSFSFKCMSHRMCSGNGGSDDEKADDPMGFKAPPVTTTLSQFNCFANAGETAAADVTTEIGDMSVGSLMSGACVPLSHRTFEPGMNGMLPGTMPDRAWVRRARRSRGSSFGANGVRLDANGIAIDDDGKALSGSLALAVEVAAEQAKRDAESAAIAAAVSASPLLLPLEREASDPNKAAEVSDPSSPAFNPASPHYDPHMYHLALAQRSLGSEAIGGKANGGATSLLKSALANSSAVNELPAAETAEAAEQAKMERQAAAAARRASAATHSERQQKVVPAVDEFKRASSVVVM